MSEIADNPLRGKSFVITGKLTMLRKEALTALENYGASVSNSVTYRTSYLVVGEKPGNTKLRAARSKGVPEITEDDLVRMIETGGYY